jgi:NAD(P)-dependent dehydrogenase (short-subunit alcohol dehydrogenase family)
MGCVFAKGMSVTAAGKVLLVTGGGRGIGAAVCMLAGARGYRVVVNYANSADAASKLVEAIAAKGGEAIAVQGDVGSESDIMALFETIDRRYGRLDALVNNAGVVGTQMRLDQIPAERIERIMRINVLGSILCAREAVRRMSTLHGGKGGAIVNLTSASALLGAPGWYVDYAASKGAIDSFTIGLAREVAEEGVRVNAVRPGIIATDIHASAGEPDRAVQMRPLIPMKREGTADEVAAGILWLLSDEASYTTGTILTISGGR